MKLENANQWLTFVANVSVVAGIVFLAIEISQNTEATRLNTMQSMASEQADFNRSFLEPEIARILNKITESGLDSLNGTERIQLRGFDNSFLYVQQNLFYQYQAGALEDDVWNGRHRTLVNIFTNQPNMRAHWKRWGAGFGDQFRTYIDEKVIPESDRQK